MNFSRSLLLILLTSLSALPAIAQRDSMPPYQKVMDHLFETYNTDTLDLGTRSYLHFAHKPAGWFVQLEDINTRRVIVEQPLWDPTQNKWSKLDSPFLTQKNTVDPNAQYPSFASDSPFFALNLYYGYRGWEDDVIRTLQPMVATLADQQLYQLGRAWSSLADYALWPERLWQNDALRYDSTWNEKDIPKALIRRYMQCQDSAIAIYGRLAARNPRFVTHIGNIRADYSNAYMIAWLTLKMLGEDKEAGHYLVNGLFDPFVLAYFRNVLESCPPHAIWFASGDNDLCEGLYLQAHDGIRTDVTIASKGYISESRYIRYMTQLLPPSTRLAIRLPAEFYKAGKPMWHYLEAPDLATGDAATRLANIAANWKDKPISDIKPVKTPLTLSFKTVGDANTSRQFSWCLTPNQYLLVEDLFFADLFMTNAFRRPVVFSEPTFGLEPYCHLYGMLNQVFPDSVNQAAMNKANDYNLDWMLHRYDYGRLDSLSKDDGMIRAMVLAYLYHYYETVSALVIADRKPEAITLLDKYFSLFPDALIPFDGNTLALIQYYYYAGDVSKGDQLVEVLIQRLITNQDEAVQKDDQKAMREGYIIYQSILKVLDDNGRTGEVRQRLAEAQNRLNRHF